MKEYYSTNEIAEMLGVDPITIRRWIQKGKLPAIDIGKEYRVSKSDLDAFIEARRVKKGGK